MRRQRVGQGSVEWAVLLGVALVVGGLSVSMILQASSVPIASIPLQIAQIETTPNSPAPSPSPDALAETEPTGPAPQDTVPVVPTAAQDPSPSAPPDATAVPPAPIPTNEPTPPSIAPSFAPLATKTYIVEFTEPPLLDATLLENENASAPLLQGTITPLTQSPAFQATRRSAIAAQHTRFLSDVSDLAAAEDNALPRADPQRGDATVALPAPRFEYANVLNGIAIDLTDAQAEALAAKPYLKRISPAQVVQAELAASVPVIRADKAWELNAHGASCSGAPVGQEGFRAFVSSRTFDGSLGGLAGADAKCQELARTAGLDGRWMAYLGTETLSPQARLSDSIRPYFRIDGVRIAMDYADLADESVLEPLDIDEYGAPASGPVWTGSSAWVAEYRGITSDTCDQWTVNSGYYKRGVSGSTDDWRLNPAGRQEAGRWEGFGYTRCDQKNRLYCIEQPLLACGDLSCDADESAQNCPSDCAADPADTVCLTGKGITIGIIDTGVDYSHPDLGGSESVAAIASDFVMPPFPRFNAKVIGGYDFLNQDPDPMDDHGHGTHVASIAAGRGTLDGVAPEAQIVAYKVLGASGSGSSEAVIAAIERAMDPNLDGDFSDHLDVINLSLGTECWKYSPDCGPDDPLSTAIDTAVANGVVAVVSAGNRGPGRGTIGSPATARDAITVGAVTKVDQPVSFSAHGPVEWTAADGTFHSLQKPDIVAPGVMICAAEHADAWAASRCIDDRHIMLSGTSMAAPHAAGAAALLLQKHPDWTPQDIKTALRVSAKDLGAQTYVQGYGRLDALAALRVPTRPPIGRLSTIGPATGMIDIYGTATGTDFARFSLYYTAYSPDGAPSPLRLIATGGSAVTDGVLSSQFDTRRLDSGEYELRLVVESTDGSTAQDRSLIMVQNLEITAIGTHVNHLRADEPVFGVVSPGGYTDLRVEYLPKGADATGVWSTACVAQQPMEENTVCVIDTATLPNGNYSFRLAATLEGEPVHGNAFDAVVFKELLAGWPQEFDGFAGGLPALGRENGGAKLALPYWIGCENGTQGSQPNGTGLAQGVLWTQGLSFDANRPAPPFVDQNGVPDMPCEPSGALHIFDAFGAMTDVKALSDTAGSYGVPRDMAPVVLQSEGQSDALVLMKTSFDTNYQRAGVSDFTGRLQHRWDLENGTNGFFSTVRDGEVFSIGIATPTDDYLLNAFHADGNSLQGFPVSIASDPHQFRFIYPQAVGVNAPDRKRVAVLVGTAQYGDERLHDLEVFLDLYDLNGDRASHTLLVDGGDAYLDPYSASVLTADVRDDAQEEIAVGLFMYDQDQINANAFEPDGYRTEFFVLDANGTLLSRPRTETGRAFTRMIAADVGREKQVLAAAFSDTLSNYNSRLIAFDGYGDNVFHALVESAKDTALRVLGLVSADVDADGDPEFILSYEPVYSEFHGPSGIVIYDTNGERKEEFTIPATGYADHLTDPIVTDFDDDGLTDVVIVSTHVATNEQGKTRVYAFSLGTPYRFRVTDWPMYLHDAQHSACARCGALFAQSQSIETGVRRAGDGRINNVVIRDVPQESETIPFKQ